MLPGHLITVYSCADGIKARCKCETVLVELTRDETKMGEDLNATAMAVVGKGREYHVLVVVFYYCLARMTANRA